MCEKCVEIDRVIESYRHLQRTILDQVTVARAKALIIELLAQKAARHPKQGSAS
jgi:hypothetical protein